MSKAIADHTTAAPVPKLARRHSQTRSGVPVLRLTSAVPELWRDRRFGH
jgi:hypothetical protein